MDKFDSTIDMRRGASGENIQKVEGRELEQMEKIARWLDDLIRIPILNIKIGLDPILGLFPFIGDTATAVLSMYLIGSALYYQVPKIIILRMALNVGFDYLVGIIPFVGGASDFFIKSNRWNMNLLRRYARERRRPTLSDYLFVCGVIAGLVLIVIGGIAFVFYSLSAAGKLIWF
jgi:preprotein translocase subunit Sss1